MIEIINTSIGKGVRTLSKIEKNTKILTFGGVIESVPSKYSLQVSETTHICSYGNDISDFVNHSCNPNCYIQFLDLLTITAIRDIEPNEELSFNYLTTELEMSNPFICSCGNDNCYKTIKGFKFLDQKARKDIEIYLSPFLIRAII